MRRVLKLGYIGFVLGLDTDRDIPVDATLSVRFYRPDGELFTLPATRVAIRRVTLTSDATWYASGKFEVSGRHRCELLIDAEAISQTFLLPVEGIAGE